MKYLDELRKLNLPKTQYVIFGSGPLSIRGIRENHDIDILVNDELWNRLKTKYEITEKAGRPNSIYIGNLQILHVCYRDWGEELPNQEVLINDSEIIENLPFVKMKYLLCCKKQMTDNKHENDVFIIEQYLKNN